MTIIPTGDYQPDKPAYLGSHATVASNLLPRSDGSDGPLQGPVVMSDAFAAAVYGGFVAIDGDDVNYLFTGSASDLALLSAAAWGSVGQGTYTATRATPWRFTQFGSDVLATNYTDPVQTYTLGAGTDFADLAAAAPKGKFIATIEPGFVMLGNINDGDARPSTLRWCAIDDPSDWPIVGTSDAASKQSDEQTLPNGGTIMGLQGAVGGAAGAVWTHNSLYRIEYIGAPAVFAFREIGRGAGCIAPNATVTVGGMAYYISEEGFQRLDGVAETPIGYGRVSRSFFSSVDASNLDMVWATVDPIRKLIVWAYPDSGAGDGYANRWLIYNYAADRWRYADADEVKTQCLFPARSTGYTLDTIDTVLTSGLDAYGALSLDTALYNGGQRLLAGFDTSGRLVSYEGATLAARVETGETDAQGNRVYVTGIRPLTDATAPTAGVGYRAALSDDIAYTTSTAIGADNMCPQRVETRYARARIEIPAGADWSYLQGADVVFRAGGKR